MRPYILRFLPILGLLAVSGCYSFDTTGVPNTVPFPQEYVTRSIIGQTTPTAEYDLCDMVGFVADQTTPGTGGNPILTPYVPITKTGAPAPKTTVVPSTAAQKYSDTVTKTITAKGTYTIFASSMADNEAASVVLQDVAFCKVPRSSIPIEQLMAFTVPSGKNYVWVSGAILTTIDYKVGVTQSAGATLTGTAFAVGGSVYDSKNPQSRISLIGADTVDIAALKTLCSGNPNPCLFSGIPPEASGGPVKTTPIVAPSPNPTPPTQ